MADVIEVVGGSVTLEVTQGSSTTVGLTAPAGPQGIQGVQGVQGPPGTTDFTQLQNVPATFPPSSHTHPSSEITDFNSAASAAAPVQSVAGRTGTISLVKADVGLGGADNTSDLNKPISTATQTALDGKAATVHTHPSSAITDFSTAAAAASPVQSVAGKTGSVALVKADVGLGSVDNTADTAKPVSTAQQTALNSKANISHTHAVADVTGLQTALDGKAASSHTHTPSDVGLGNVSNTAQVTSVTGTAPISSSGGTTPAISISAATTSAAGSMSSADKTKLDAITGTNTGDQTITLTGNVTGSGTGSFAATIANDAVTNAKLANVATSTIKGRATASTGDPEDLSASQVRTILNVADGATANTASTATPSALGTAAAGTSADFSRADHVHSADLSDSAFRVVGSSDATKKVAFEVDGITTATTRTITVPDKSLTLDDSGDTRDPNTHAASHAAAGSDPVTPAAISAMYALEVRSNITATADETLAVGRNIQQRITIFAATNINITLPFGSNIAGDTFTILANANSTGDIVIRRRNWSGSGNGPEFTTLATATGTSELYIFRATTTDGSWELIAVATHTHPASAITSGTLDIARVPTGTTSTTVALGDHTHELDELDATGATNGHVLTAQGDGTAAFAAASGGGASINQAIAVGFVIN